MKPLILRIQAKDEGATATLAATQKGLESTVASGKAAGKEAADLSKEMTGAGRAAAATGKQVGAAMEQAEQAIKPAVATADELRDRLKKLGGEGAASLAQLKNGAAGVDQLLRVTLGAEQLDRAAEGLQSIADAAGRIYGSFAEAGAGTRELERGLNRAFASPEKAEPFIKLARDLRHEYQDIIPLDQIREGITALNRFGVATEENVRRVTALAASNPDLSVGQVAETYGEFKKAALGGKHDFGSTEELRSQLGIDPKELEPFGAQLDSNNKLLGDTADQATAAQKALDAFIDAQERYQGVAERGADGQSKLTAEMDKFKSSVGDAVTDFQNFVAEGLLPAAKYLNSFSDETKAAVAGTAIAVKGVASLGAGVAQTAAFTLLAANQLKNFTAGATGVVTAAQLATAGTVAMGAGMVTAAAGVGLIVYEFYEMVKAANQAEAAEKSLRETQAKALEGQGRGLVDLDVKSIEKAADEIEDYGKRRAFITEAIDAKDAAADKARDKGNQEAAARYQADLDALRDKRNSLDQTIAVEVEGNKAIAKSHEEAYSRALEAFNAFKKAQSRGQYGTAKESATALAAVIPGLKGDARDEAEGELKKYRQAALKEELDDLKAQLELKKATRKVSLTEELADLKKQKDLALQLGRDGMDEQVRIAKEVAAAKANAQKEADKATKESAKKAKAEAIKDLKDASKLGADTLTYDRGTGQAVDAYEQAIQKVKAWRKENAALIKQMPELGQAGEQAIEKLRLGQAQANVASMAKNLQDLQRELKLLDDKAVTTKDKLAAIAEGDKKIQAAVAGKRISREQGDQLLDPRKEKKADLDRTDLQEQLQQRQALLQLDQAAAQQELEMAETVADGTLRSNDKILLAKEKLHQLAIDQIQLEAEAARAAGEEQVAIQNRTNAQLANLQRERTLDFMKAKKAEVDAERDKLQQIIELNKPAQAQKTQLDLSGVPTDQAGFFTVGLSGEEYQKHKETRRAEAELRKLDASEAFRRANPELVAKMAEQERQKALQAADPGGIIRNVNGKMEESQKAATGGVTVNNHSTMTLNLNNRAARTVDVKSPQDVLREVKKGMDDQAFFNGGPGSGQWFS